jgi:hypothetical protein
MRLSDMYIAPEAIRSADKDGNLWAFAESSRAFWLYGVLRLLRIAPGYLRAALAEKGKSMAAMTERARAVATKRLGP